MQQPAYTKRLIEVDLPIKRISAHSRREKSIRHGHISTLHIWWARRPLAACRAVICAALWPDPADPLCPHAFIVKAREEMLGWTSHERQKLLSTESRPHFEAARQNPSHFDDLEELRYALLDFIADFANWDNSTVKEYLGTSRALTQAAHEALGGAPGTRPLVVDPFAGGGSIPLEALRVGADAFASDLNPIPVLLNKVVLEYIPKYGQRLADEVRKWGEWIKKEAEKELAEFYPKDPDGATPIAYLWARTIQCEGPGCGAEVPLIRSLWLAKKAKRSIALRIVVNKNVGAALCGRPDDGVVGAGFKPALPNAEQAQQDRAGLEPAPTIDFEIINNVKAADVGEGTAKRGSGTCPCCGFTTPVTSVRKQLKTRRGGADDARLFAVVTTRPGQQGRFYRLPMEHDLRAVEKAEMAFARRKREHEGVLSLFPDEQISQNEIRRISVPLYGMSNWGDLFAARQALTLSHLIQLLEKYRKSYKNESGDTFLSTAIQTCLALIFDKFAQYNTSLCRWKPTGENVVDTFGRQALGMVWDFAEANPFGKASGDISELAAWHIEGIVNTDLIFGDVGTAHVARASATNSPLSDDFVNAVVTDPPYYDAIPYSHLSDFFYVLLKRSLTALYPDLFSENVVDKVSEIVVDRPHSLSSSLKDISFYESELCKAFIDANRVLRPDGIGVIVFASKTTASWEAILAAVVNAGWIITGSWPIDTEMETRVAAQGQARLASSIHIVCRPRENPDGSVRTGDIGDWRDVLAELPKRIHDWMPRLAEEGVVGADAIFACLGPALEIFSRYSSVEKASGEQVTLKVYLEQVWAAVAKEALAQVFKDADTAGFEPDARLTAMWLWTLNAASPSPQPSPSRGEGEEEDEEESKGKSKKAKGGFVLEYDAARKIAQGLGANLETLIHVIEVSGETARLLPVAERTQYLFGKEQSQAPTTGRKKKVVQQDLFGELTQASDSEVAWGEKTVQRAGETTLDRVHQSMILFASGRGEALKRFLVEDGAGRDQKFWSLAQALSALYPSSSDEKRWVDGVLARKKGLGL